MSVLNHDFQEGNIKRWNPIERFRRDQPSQVAIWSESFLRSEEL